LKDQVGDISNINLNMDNFPKDKDTNTPLYFTDVIKDFDEECRFSLTSINKQTFIQNFILNNL
jgi:hypothetical protein